MEKMTLQVPQGKTQIFLQARLRSARLPQKVLLKILGKSVLELIVERLRNVQNVQKVILVTGPKEENEALVKEAERIGIPYFCGSEENVLDRFYQAAKVFQPDIIIRVTGDCPLIDAGIINEGLKIFKEGKYDIVGNIRVRTYPDGMDFEVFSAKALETAWHDAASLHPTQHILQDPKFKVKDIQRNPNLSHIRLTLDYAEDFEVIEKIYQALYKEGEYFGLSAVLELLKEHEELLKINEAFIKTDYGIRTEKM